LILMRSLPGLGALEWAISQNGWTEENEEWAARLSEHYFGIDEEDTYPWVGEDGLTMIGGVPASASDRADILLKCAAWEEHFEPLKLFRDESDVFWAELGWDVTDGNGKQLESMRAMGRPLICALNKLHVDARLSLGDEREAEAWAAKLAEEARTFKSRN
jgi:hypothetical protein